MEQIVGILKQAEVGIPVADLIRQAGISEQTFYRWKKQYVGLEVDQVRQLRQVQEENVRLKRLGAEMILDKTMLQDVLAKQFEGLQLSTIGILLPLYLSICYINLPQNPVRSGLHFLRKFVIRHCDPHRCSTYNGPGRVCQGMRAS